MLRKFLDYQLKFFKKDKLKFLSHVIEATDNFCYEPLINVKTAPFIRDSVDLKRWMMIVIFSLSPAIFMAIWNTGVQKFIYNSTNYLLIQEFLQASQSIKSYITFFFSENRFFNVIKEGLKIFLPLLALSYGVGGLCEIVFSIVRKHPIAEGLLVTGMLFPLILPPTIPYWMAALGIIFGTVVGKELFGGTGMNILNPALTGRAFLFFTFPSQMTGDVWVGNNSYTIANNIRALNQTANLSTIDGLSQASCLQTINTLTSSVKKIHVDAIFQNVTQSLTKSSSIIQEKLNLWSNNSLDFPLSLNNLQNFLTAPIEQGGLALSPSLFESAYHNSYIFHGIGKFSNLNLFFGNIPGSIGETSKIACLLGAILLIITGVGCWRTMLAFLLGAFSTAVLFFYGASIIGGCQEGWLPAIYFIPPYKHLLMGGLMFGLVYMATDPVSSPVLNKSKWLYGILIGSLTILIRIINPAYPEGVMLAILFGNIMSPLLDHYSMKTFKRKLSRE